MAAPKTRVVFALDLTTLDGHHHKGGTEAAIDADEARDLVHRGLVQLAKSETPTPAAVTQDDNNKGGK